MLPADFTWKRRCHLSTVDDGLHLDGVPVAYLIDKVDGGWFAVLEMQRDPLSKRPRRDCSSLEAGRRGCELWATRHEERLRREVAEKIATMPWNNWRGGG
ncbi:hypothetical protein CSC62_07620 [Pseudoxanthomonas jiangsuensis]|uniref:hypothetical protein n=1 Tax=Pseudoxanthomonas jiangsuensis TaxID=619688 RepID=UPI001391EFC0|nr:hypothetical protein [Pseudoxanthomonas jiangsuensis]KAF1698005.1 hypothetical protein CSC62_07620 [Pseudoxanthomonas jiangsuensis]